MPSSILDRGLTTGGQFRLAPALLTPGSLLEAPTIKVVVFTATVVEPIKEVAIAVVSPIKQCSIQVNSIIVATMPLPTRIPKGTTVKFVVSITFNVNPVTAPKVTYLAESINCHETVYVATGNGVVFNSSISNSDGTFTYNYDVTLPAIATQNLKTEVFRSYLRLFFDDGTRLQAAQSDVRILPGEPQVFAETYSPVSV